MSNEQDLKCGDSAMFSLAITESEVHASNSIWTFGVSGFKTPDPSLLLVKCWFCPVLWDVVLNDSLVLTVYAVII